MSLINIHLLLNGLASALFLVSAILFTNNRRQRALIKQLDAQSWYLRGRTDEHDAIKAGMGQPVWAADYPADYLFAIRDQLTEAFDANFAAEVMEGVWDE